MLWKPAIKINEGYKLGYNVPGYNTNTDTISALCDYFEIEPGELLKKV